MTFGSEDTGRAADALRRGVRRLQLRVLLLERDELAVVLVVDVVADLGIVEDVIAVGVVVQELPKLCRAILRLHSTSSAAGASRRARSKAASASIPAWAVRSKWIGVTAIRPAATAARSVPGSSW